ncbi:hypothetical protein BKA80DRAFT_303988 [Phyllosticta citrichinensis]
MRCHAMRSLLLLLLLLPPALPTPSAAVAPWSQSRWCRSEGRWLSVTWVRHVGPRIACMMGLAGTPGWRCVAGDGRLTDAAAALIDWWLVTGVFARAGGAWTGWTGPDPELTAAAAKR